MERDLDLKMRWICFWWHVESYCGDDHLAYGNQMSENVLMIKQAPPGSASMLQKVCRWFDVMTVFIQGSNVQAAQMSHQLDGYSEFLCVTFLDEFPRSECFFESIICGQKAALGPNTEDQILHCNEFTEALSLFLASWWPLGWTLSSGGNLPTWPSVLAICLFALRPTTCPSSSL